jgi:hypothetical protein
MPRMLAQFGAGLAEIAEGLLSGFAGVTPPSLPGSTRQSIDQKRILPSKMDARVKPAHDGLRNYEADDYALLASVPSIIAIAFVTPYTATNEPKRGPFSWPSSTW